MIVARLLLLLSALVSLAPIAVASSETAPPGTLVRLELPDDLPETFSVEALVDGRPVVLDLEKRSVRAAGFRLRAWADGETRVIEPPPVSTYRGRVRDDERSVAAGTLGPAGLSLRVFASDGTTWSLEPAASSSGVRGEHRLSRGSDWPEGLACGVDPAGRSATSGDAASHDPAPMAQAPPETDLPAMDGARELPGLPGAPGREAPSPMWCGSRGMKLAQIAFDVDQVYFRNHGSDVAATTANVEGLLAQVDAFYARDALITYELTDIIIRTTDFYLPDGTQGSLLGLFRDEWNANQTTVVRDIAHLMTGQPAPGLAGLAYVGVTCNLAWCYGWSVDSAGVLGHEVGHNWSAGHCHDVAPCNNMCGACLSIGPNTKDIILRYRDAAGCLDDVPAHAAPVPPYAHPDAVELTRSEAVARAPVLLDVLANDHDANCDDVRIASFDAISARGGTISLDAGGGPGGRDRLAYEAPCMPYSGVDTFTYELTDDAGGSSVATVSADILDPGLVGAWPLDEASGSVAGDLTGWARDGAVQGTPDWIAGRVGGALQLDGATSSVTVPRLDLARLPVTITAWVRRRGPQDAFAGIAFCRGGSTTAGLHVGNANELRYTWADDPATWGSNSGLVLPDGAWAFVALVVEDSRARLVMDDGATWQSWENPIPHAVQRFDADWHLGWDPTSAARHFDGALDDVRVHDGALSDAELRALRDGSSRAIAPRPPDGGFASDPFLTLSWTAAPLASEHDVYFGTSFEAVSSATPGSPEYLGRFAGSSAPMPDAPAEGFTYAWRVDGIVGGSPVRGDTWLFTFRGRTAAMLHHWGLDEGAGLTTADGVTGTPADLRNGTSWGGGVVGGAAIFDGTNDVVAAPLPGTTLAEATITAWIRTSGTPAGWAGLVFTRGGAATGLNFRGTPELGYHWADGHWGWASGLTVPLDAWIFVALAVAPDRATIHLHDGTGWRQATNVAGHAAAPWTGELLIGRDPWGAARSFAGAIDDVRVFDRALTASEIARVRDEPSRAMNPSPPDGRALLLAPAGLAWTPGALATSHDLYVSDDLAALLAAGPGSPEHRGNLAVPSWIPPADLLRPDRTWYWRVDERGPSGTATGDPWRFALVGSVGDSLRVRKSATGAPILIWQRPGATESFEILRCADTGPGDCPRSPVATLPGDLAEWEDPGAVESLVWYEVASTPCLP